MASGVDSLDFSEAAMTRNFDFSRTTTVLIGQNEKKFVLHKQILEAASVFFKRGGTGNWLEVQIGVWKLPDVREDVFELFTHWLYTGRVEVALGENLDMFLVTAWALGDRLQAKQFKNAVANTLCDIWDKKNEDQPESLAPAVLAFKLTPAHSKLRKLVVYALATNGNPDSFIYAASDFVATDLVVYLTEIMASVLLDAREGREVIFNDDVCDQYHEHDAGHKECSENDLKTTYTIWDTNEERYETVDGLQHPFANMN